MQDRGQALGKTYLLRVCLVKFSLGNGLYLLPYVCDHKSQHALSSHGLCSEAKRVGPQLISARGGFNGIMKDSGLGE